MSVLQQITKEARKYVLHHYGNLLTVEEPVFDDKERVWKAVVKADYPRLIKNDSPEERFVRTLLIKDLGSIWVDEELKILKSRSTPRGDCLDTLRSRLKTWEKRAESIIVKTSAYQLAKTGIAQVFLNPISTILVNFLEEEATLIPFEEIEKLRKTERYFQWMFLLEDLEFVRKTSDGYTYGNMFTELRRKVEDDAEFLTHILAHVIRERYSMLKEVFQLRQLESLVHLDSCYYRPALEARRVLLQTAESLFNRYLSNYRYRSRLELPMILFELCNSRALMRQGKYYFANEELFEEMIKISEDFITISSPKV